jgi:hypothetical protein
MVPDRAVRGQAGKIGTHNTAVASSSVGEEEGTVRPCFVTKHKTGLR